MKILSNFVRSLPFLILCGVGLAVWIASVRPPAPPPPPEIPTELLVRGPTPPPRLPPSPPEGSALIGAIEAPDVVALGLPVEITLSATNTGTVPLTEVVLWLPLPEGTHTRQLERFVRFTTSTLAPGEQFKREALLIPTQAGLLKLKTQFRCAEGLNFKTEKTVRLPTAVLSIEFRPNTDSNHVSPRTLCCVVSNLGDAPARDVVVRLLPGTIPPLKWPQLEPGEIRDACFEIPTASDQGERREAEVSATAADVARVMIK